MQQEGAEDTCCRKVASKSTSRRGLVSLLAGVPEARTRFVEGLETCSGESCGVSNPDPILSKTHELPFVAGSASACSRSHRTASARLFTESLAIHIYAENSITLTHTIHIWR